MKKRILITGAGGLLAPYLLSEAVSYGDVVTTSRNTVCVRCDLTDKFQVKRLMSEVKPHWIIHAAAMTNVDQCECESSVAGKINALSVKHIVDSIDPDVQLVYLSTDQVYPNIAGPHKEEKVEPINVYGKTKLQGENNALVHSNSVVYRINFFGHSLTKGRDSLDDFVVNNLRLSNPITLFSDVLFSPLHMSTLVELILFGLKRKRSGVFNLGCREGMSKAAFGLAVAKHLNLNSENATVGKSSSMQGRALRPLDLRMDVSKIEAAMNRKMPTLLEEIEKL